MLRKTEIRLAQFLIRRQWCTLSQIIDALDHQKKLKAKDQQQPLGMLLVARGSLDEKRLMRALAELGSLILRCGGCEKAYRVPRFDPRHNYRCPDCRGQLLLGHLGRGSPPVEPYRPPPETGESGDSSAAQAADSEISSERDRYIGRVLGGCQLTDKIATGGMGVVYKARQLNLNRIVAVKILSDELARDATFVRRFMEEARAAGQLSHGNIVHINDVGEYQGTFYFIMEYVEGQSLKELLNKETSLPVAQALEITLQVCRALQHAHSRGIVHRDIKPENIMLTADGSVKLADLGLAKQLTPSGDHHLTQVGSILGTPYYMAPEQAKDFSNVDRRSDIYSLGVTLYKTVSGRVPFSGRSPIEIMIKVVEGRRPALSELCPGVCPEVERIVDRMMCLDPDRRYQTVSELMADIREVAEALGLEGESEPVLEHPQS